MPKHLPVDLIPKRTMTRKPNEESDMQLAASFRNMLHTIGAKNIAQDRVDTLAI
ncbi:MAG: hypothetical protein ACLQIQ_17495 [Beijerinckiaceae bacterium]